MREEVSIKLIIFLLLFYFSNLQLSLHFSRFHKSILPKTLNEMMIIHLSPKYT